MQRNSDRRNPKHELPYDVKHFLEIVEKIVVRMMASEQEEDAQPISERAEELGPKREGVYDN